MIGKWQQQAPEPGIYLIATPIGNLEDITLRALRILDACDVLACEDTRITRRLFQRHNIPAPRLVTACHAHNERSVARRLVGMALTGKVVAYVSDAGMPGVSDPGYALANEAIIAGARLEAIPGPSASLAALALAGVPNATFTFLGFPPRKDGRLTTLLAEEGGKRHAMVFYESPRRLVRLLSAAARTLGGERRAAVCLELTKKFERTERGILGDLTARFSGLEEIRGEATVVIAGRSKKREDGIADNDGDDIEGSGEPRLPL